MLRSIIAQKLRDDNILPVTLHGGIYPTIDNEASAMSFEDFPTAFDAQRRIKPCALVQDEGSFSIPNLDRGESAVFKIFLWQLGGRANINSALVRIREILNPISLQVGSLWVYQLQWTGDGPNLRDQALDDAEMGWSNWQTVATR